jgi:aminocarboxymuconate-semialdehyde decarboxylase
MERKGRKNQFRQMDRRTFLKAGSAISLGVAATFGASGATSAESEKKRGRKDFGEKIDMFCHALTPKYMEAISKKARPSFYFQSFKRIPALFDLDMRFRAMDKYPGYRQVLSIGVPPVELVLSPKDAVDLSRMGNDEMAELVNKYPDRFVAALAGLPMNDVDASIRETERAIKELKFKGVQIYSSVNGKPLDRPEFSGLFEKIAQLEVPIWLHPVRDNNIPDYPDEKLAKYGSFVAFGWPFETTMAMARLVFSGLLEKYPNIKFITHHCGAMLPGFFKRIGLAQPEAGEIMALTKPPLEYFKKFYADTALGGNTPALMSGYAFFGADHMLFATDYPYPGGTSRGDIALKEEIEAVELMNLTDEEKVKIFSKNAKRILSLS